MKRAHQSTHGVYNRHHQARKRKERTQKTWFLPYFELNQSTKPLMVTEWSSMYTLINSKKFPIKEDLIGWSIVQHL